MKMIVIKLRRFSSSTLNFVSSFLQSKRDQNDYDYEDDFEDVDAEEVVLKRVKPPVKKIVKVQA